MASKPHFRELRGAGPVPHAVRRPSFGTGLLSTLLLAACLPLDRPPISTEGLPEAAVAFLQPDRLSVYELEDGVVYRSIQSGERSWAVHLVEVDAWRCELGFQVVRAGDEEGRVKVTEMAGRIEPGVLAAVNGDLYTPEDVPLGVEVTAGELRGHTSRPVFAWRPGELPWVGPVEWGEDSLRIGSWAVSRDAPDQDVQVVAGFPSLLENGKIVGDLEMGERPGFAAEPHPRTAVGFDLERGVLWLVVVDGRRRGVGEGMTLPELAGLLRALGAHDAINLDGGGSSVMVIRGQAVSRPSDLRGQRPVVNALVLRRDAAYCGADLGRPERPERGGGPD